MSVRQISSKSEMDSAFASAGGKLIVCCFSASWCGPCRRLAPLYEAMAAEHQDVVFLKVMEDNAKDLVHAFNVSAFPTTQFFIKGDKKQEIRGGDANGIQSAISTLKTQAVASFAGTGASLGGSAAADPRAARLARLARLSGTAAPAPAPAPAPAAAAPAPAPAPAPTPAPAPAAVDFEDAELQAALAASLALSEESNTAPASAPAPAPAPVASNDAAAAAKPGLGAVSLNELPAAPSDPMLAPESDLPVEPTPSGSDGAPAMIEPTVNAEFLSTLQAMGFTENGSKRALYNTGNGSLEAAVEWLGSHATDPDLDTPLLLPAVSAVASPGRTPEERERKKAELKALMARKRQERMEAEAIAEKEREIQRRENAKGMKQTREKLEALQRQREIERRRKEKEDAKKERERLRLEMAKDKAERLAAKGLEVPPELLAAAQGKGKVGKAATTTPEEQLDKAIKSLLGYKAGGDGIRALKTLRLYVNNVVTKDDPRVLSINAKNEKFRLRVGSLVGGPGVLRVAGFKKDEVAQKWEFDGERDEAHLSRCRMVVEKLDAALAASS